MSPHVLRLHHVGIVVQNMRESLAWYRDNLGFEHQYDFTLPGAKVTMIVRGDARLELYQVEGAAPMMSERKEVETILKFEGVNHLGLTVEDLDATITALEAKGVEIVIPPTAVPNESGDRFAFIRDYERNLVELFQVAA
jgi:catechol 2,3-dioxygenase-like lactoylglutathione lyase family enzyme